MMSLSNCVSLPRPHVMEEARLYDAPDVPNEVRPAVLELQTQSPACDECRRVQQKASVFKQQGGTLWPIEMK